MHDSLTLSLNFSTFSTFQLLYFTLRRWNTCLLQVDVVHEGGSRLDETFFLAAAVSSSSSKTDPLVCERRRGWDDRLDLLSDLHLRDHLVDAGNDGRTSQLEQQRVVLSLGVGGIEDLARRQVAGVFDGDDIAGLWIPALRLLVSVLQDGVFDPAR